MDHQKRESSGIKTHEEIIALFKELEIMEEKIKNPELLVEELFEPETLLQEIELPPQISLEVVKEPQITEPVEEIPNEKKEKRKRSPLFKLKREKQPTEKKIKRLRFWRKATIGEIEPSAAPELQQLEGEKTLRSTFILQFDADGNLVGLPVKKPKPTREKKGRFPFRRKEETGATEQSEEEPTPGIKGKLKRVTSRLRRKKSSEGESGGGISGKIKGIFRRKSKE